MQSPRFTLATIANRVGGELRGEEITEISGLGTLDTAGPNQIAFVRSATFWTAARASQAGALLVSEFLDVSCPQICVSNPDLAFAKAAQLFFPRPRATSLEIHSSAFVDETADLESPVRIGAGAIIDAGAKIGAGTVIGPGCVVESGASIGQNCTLFANVTVCRDVRIGNRVVLHPGAVIGADGFGFAPDDGTWTFIPQIGTVQLDDDVEVGANSTIDRGTMSATTIERGTKIDNMVHIGHNCRIGEHSIIAGFSALSGSVTLGHHCILAGHVTVSGHLNIAAGTQIGGASVVLRSIPEKGKFMGHPLMPFQHSVRWMRKAVEAEAVEARAAALARRTPAASAD